MVVDSAATVAASDAEGGAAGGSLAVVGDGEGVGVVAGAIGGCAALQIPFRRAGGGVEIA